MQQNPKISVNILGYNEKHFLKDAIERVSEQDYPNYEITYIDNDSTDESEQYVRENFPNVKVIQTGFNNHYGPAHNKGIVATDGEFVCILNSDLKLAPDFLSEAIKPMLADEKIAGVQGKLVRPEKVDGKFIIDGTGLIINRARTVRDRGQLEVDEGQYDTPGPIFGVNGAAPLYRRSALEDIAYNGEVIDEDMTAFFDDSDLGWRLRHRGWDLVYQPTAIVYHERGYGQSPGGYRKFISFVKHRKSFSIRARRLGWKNKIFLVLKNDYGKPFRRDFPRFVLRQVIEFGYLLVFEPEVLKAVPLFFKQLPSILRKRKYIQQTAKVSPEEIDKWLVK